MAILTVGVASRHVLRGLVSCTAKNYIARGWKEIGIKFVQARGEKKGKVIVVFEYQPRKPDGGNIRKKGFALLR